MKILYTIAGICTVIVVALNLISGEYRTAFWAGIAFAWLLISHSDMTKFDRLKKHHLACLDLHEKHFEQRVKIYKDRCEDYHKRLIKEQEENVMHRKNQGQTQKQIDSLKVENKKLALDLEILNHKAKKPVKSPFGSRKLKVISKK